MKRILFFAGTRPEAIKLAPLVMELRRDLEHFTVRLCTTGQHREMLYQAFSDFDLAPDIDLHVMTPNQTLAGLTARLFTEIDGLLDQERPDAIVVQGDTTTVMVAAMCAFYRDIPVGHVEAGLRSFQRRVPFPEEFNRRVASIAADLHFCPTDISRKNLRREGVAEQTIYVTGNTVVDALLYMVKKVRATPAPLPSDVAEAVEQGRPIVLITGHRRESFGDGFRNICRAIGQLAEAHPEVRFIYPVHLNPNVQNTVREILGNRAGVILCAPLAYKQFVQLMDKSRIILSDSGGIQEEAPSLGKPVLVMRKVTERPEGVQAGTSKLVGTDVATIVNAVTTLLTDEGAYNSVAQVRNPFGDGKAAKKIAAVLREA